MRDRPGWKNAMGLADIVRFGYGSFKQLGGGFIAVPDSGPLRITRAPLGPKVVTSARRRGEFEFTASGVSAAKSTSANATATLSNGQVIRAVPAVRGHRTRLRRQRQTTGCSTGARTSSCTIDHFCFA